MTLRDFNETFAYKLRDPEYLAAYLEACLEEGLPVFYVGLRKAVQAHEGGFTWLAKETGMVRAGLYQALSADGNPSFKTIHRVLNALGVDTAFLTARAGQPRTASEPEREFAIT
jgi:probable addiction module antidote protein